MNDGPFTDDFVRHGLLTVQTQRGIIEYAEGMAQILAEAGRASRKATGDSADYAIDRWSDVIRKRAHDILKDDSPTPTQKKIKEKMKELKSG